MPGKIRELIPESKTAGSVDRGEKGNHRNDIHPKGIILTLSGNSGTGGKP